MKKSQAIFNRVDETLTAWMARYGIFFLRISLGLIFFWFGLLKFFPGLSPAQDLAARTINQLSFGMISMAAAVIVLAVWECLIGLGLIFRMFMRATLFLLFLQMLGTFAPLFLFPQEVLTHSPMRRLWKGSTSSKRINMRYHLNPLSKKETKEYIEKRLRTAGAKERLFTEKAIEEIYRRSKGTPRIINILCDNSLLNGYALEQKNVDDKSVKEAARDLHLRSFPRLWTWVIISLCIVGMALIFLLLQKSGLLVHFYKGILKSLQNIGDAALNGFQNVLNF